MGESTMFVRETFCSDNYNVLHNNRILKIFVQYFT